jgi:hypothetical protein
MCTRQDRIDARRTGCLDPDVAATPDDCHGGEDLHGMDLRSPAYAEKVKVAHPVMLRAIAAAKKKNDKIDAGKIADCLRCDFLPECHMASTQIRDRGRTLRYLNLVIREKTR